MSPSTRGHCSRTDRISKRPILNVALAVEQATHNAEPAGTSVFVTGEVYRDLADTQWRERLKLAEIQSQNRLPANITF